MMRTLDKNTSGLMRLSEAFSCLAGRNSGYCAEITRLREMRQTARNTPLIDLSQHGLEIPNNNRIVAKLEMNCYSAEGMRSHYFRVYPYLIDILLGQGLTPDKYAVVEVSSGSAGEAFAHVAKAAGFEAHCVLPNEISEKRRALSKAQGSAIHLPDPEVDGNGVLGAVNKLKRMLKEKYIDGKKLWCPNHANVVETSHALLGIPVEIIEQIPALPSTKIDVFIGVAGNGSTLYSIGSALKLFGAIDRIIAIEPFTSPGLYELKYPGRYLAENGTTPSIGSIPIPGSGSYGLEFPYLRASVDITDDVTLIRDNEWIETRDSLFERTGIFVGPSSAASLMAAMRLAQDVHDKTFLVVFYDSGGRY